MISLLLLLVTAATVYGFSDRQKDSNSEESKPPSVVLPSSAVRATAPAWFKDLSMAERTAGTGTGGLSTSEDMIAEVAYEDDYEDDEDGMAQAATVVFRPLFVHQQRQTARRRPAPAQATQATSGRRPAAGRRRYTHRRRRPAYKYYYPYQYYYPYARYAPRGYTV